MNYRKQKQDNVGIKLKECNLLKNNEIKIMPIYRLIIRDMNGYLRIFLVIMLLGANPS
ncbi:hypothetical protein ALC53_09100 [Atta colombica]|uniref:Uncharacterized protein n=1 Tax=Atta colombica TaxID=520822 RepID=A0A195B7P6_9HYME|nr:hypothetical protein ALC53_09100 [Atta colombica]